jgi:hypothetical protein
VKGSDEHRIDFLYIAFGKIVLEEGCPCGVAYMHEEGDQWKFVMDVRPDAIL